jgi:hypothetical protein
MHSFVLDIRVRTKGHSKQNVSTHPAGDVVYYEMIQPCFESLLMSDDAFCAVAIQLIISIIALAVHDDETSIKEE